MVYSLADYKIEFDSTYNTFKRFCAEYECSDEPDFNIIVSPEDVLYEESVAEGTFGKAYLETLAFYRKLANILPSKNAFLLHSALFDVEGTGVAFAAHSGTGKTTHMLLWQKLLGDKMKIINGDKPIIRFFENEPDTPYGYGTPWNGKEKYGCNSKTKVKHICFIERSETNSCEKMQDDDLVDRILNQIDVPRTPMDAIAAMQLIDRFIKSCESWKIKCNMDIEAAEIAYNTIFKKI